MSIKPRDKLLPRETWEFKLGLVVSKLLVTSLHSINKLLIIRKKILNLVEFTYLLIFNRTDLSGMINFHRGGNYFEILLLSFNYRTQGPLSVYFSYGAQVGDWDFSGLILSLLAYCSFILYYFKSIDFSLSKTFKAKNCLSFINSQDISLYFSRKRSLNLRLNKKYKIFEGMPKIQSDRREQ